MNILSIIWRLLQVLIMNVKCLFLLNNVKKNVLQLIWVAELVLGGWRWSSLTTLLSVQKWHIWLKACQDERSPSWEYPGRHLHMLQKTEYSQRKWLGTAAVMPSNNMNKRWRNIHKDSSLLTNKTTVKNINHYFWMKISWCTFKIGMCRVQNFSVPKVFDSQFQKQFQFQKIKKN